jgi:beta-glucanase (GH16 family)
LVALWALVGVGRGADLLVSGGFESSPKGPTQTISGWNWYGQDWGNTLSVTVPRSRTGTNCFKIFQGFTGSVNYSGIYQDHLAEPGERYRAEGWAFSDSNDAIAGQNRVWLEVTFRNAPGKVLALYRSAVISASALGTAGFARDQWFRLAVTNVVDAATFQVTNTTSELLAPAGASYARCQIVFEGDAQKSAGAMFFDDLMLEKTSSPPGGVWNVVWNDEFDGTAPDPKKWTHDLGNGPPSGWGNSELEYYTARPTNVFLADGRLHIVARKEEIAGFHYTSTRLKTKGLFSRNYGRIEIRAKLPAGQGLWPAIWMLPENSAYGGWAASGEIDIMENRGSKPNEVLGTLHYGGSSPANVYSQGPSFTFPPGRSTTDFNTYAIEWTTNAILWSVNGQVYETQTNWWSSTRINGNEVPNAYPAPFNQPFHLLINLAVGGHFDGSPTAETVFPAEMEVDYVRVYDRTAPLQVDVTRTNSTVRIGWNTNIVCRLQSGPTPTGAWTDIPAATNPFVPSPTEPARFFRVTSP